MNLLPATSFRAPWMTQQWKAVATQTANNGHSPFMTLNGVNGWIGGCELAAQCWPIISVFIKTLLARQQKKMAGPRIGLFSLFFFGGESWTSHYCTRKKRDSQMAAVVDYQDEWGSVSPFAMTYTACNELMAIETNKTISFALSSFSLFACLSFVSPIAWQNKIIFTLALRFNWITLRVHLWARGLLNGFKWKLFLSLYVLNLKCLPTPPAHPEVNTCKCIFSSRYFRSDQKLPSTPSIAN